MGSDRKRGGDIDRMAVKERPSSQQKLINKMTIILIVASLMVTIVVCYNLKSAKAIKELRAGIAVIITALFAWIGARIKPEWVHTIMKSKVTIGLCIAIGVLGIVWMGCLIKVVVVAEMKERMKKDAGKVEESVSNQEVSITLTRNAKTFIWEDDIYIEDLSGYYTGKIEKITEEQQITYRSNLLDEYRNNRSKSIDQKDQGELSMRNYEKLTQEANEYYQVFEFCNTNDLDDKVKLTNLNCSKKARIDADSYEKNSENQRLIAAQIIDIGQIKMQSVEEIYEPALEWQIKGYGQALVEMEEIEDEDTQQTGQNQLQVMEDSIKNSYDNLADSGDHEIAAKAKRMQQVIE